MRDLLLRELRFEGGSQVSRLTGVDIYETDGLLDFSSLGEIADLPVSELQYQPFDGASPIEPDEPIFDAISKGDILVHHPYDSFERTVERFLGEAADDPDVQSIRLTLYRSGGRSAIVDALTRAARDGKEVDVFVELKARFDEERNIGWAKKLEEAGIHVVYGLVKLKTHAKTALVVRREGNKVKRYVHIGTGNYNAATAKTYTDFGLLTANEELGADLNDLFNEFTGSSEAPGKVYRQIIVAPAHMLKRFINLIDREAEHARHGRKARIFVKLNGLADTEVIEALYRASQAGVKIDLVVRGICTLRPGVPGLSERIRVISILGRLLEHSRIYYFANHGDPEYYIGSADWRPRNLRKRVEVVAPVLDSECRSRLDYVMERLLNDPTAWELREDSSYRPRSDMQDRKARSSQELLLEAAAGR